MELRRKQGIDRREGLTAALAADARQAWQIWLPGLIDDANRVTRPDISRASIRFDDPA